MSKPRQWCIVHTTYNCGNKLFGSHAAAKAWRGGLKVPMTDVIEKTAYDKAVNALKSLVGFEPFSGLEPKRASDVLRELGELK